MGLDNHDDEVYTQYGILRKKQQIKVHLIVDEYKKVKIIRKQIKFKSDVKNALQEQLTKIKTVTPQKLSIAY
ncbi:unnamed protein product [Paramecium primaurelia]|uniref:Uncharacterized protein n=1 Tax=Paramecium primaurelia TaxID=5886 RepID=A0A8S1PRU3_PARPR|nr:unnamed protein product [Paramecium primaurelia]CAD8105365.1 unnamed protein product [Paramecium primaurelia]